MGVSVTEDDRVELLATRSPSGRPSGPDTPAHRVEGVMPASGGTPSTWSRAPFAAPEPPTLPCA